MTIKMLHISDVHLGVEKYGNQGGLTGQSTRLDDFLRSFDQAIDAAIERECDLMVFAGDAFKTRDPNPTVQREFARRIIRLVQHDIPAFLLVGNHDLPNASARAHTLEIYDTLNIPGVQVARKPGIFHVATRQGMVQVVAIPWVTPHTLLTKEENRALTIQELNGLMADKIEEIVDTRAQELDLNRPAILTMHNSVQGAAFSSEQDIMLGNDVIVRADTIRKSAFSYVALGHIHKYQLVWNEPLAVYCGSLERIDFGEEKEDKGFVIVSFDEREQAEVGQNRWRASHEFVKTAARPFLTIKVDGNVAQPTEAVLYEIGKQAKKLPGAVVKVIVRTSTEFAAALREADIRRALHEGGVSYIAAVVKDMDRGERLRSNDQLAEQLSPHEALERYLKHRKTAPARASTLLRYADELIGVGTPTTSGADHGDQDGTGELASQPSSLHSQHRVFCLPIRSNALLICMMQPDHGSTCHTI